MKKTSLLGVKIFAILLIAASFNKLFGLQNVAYYKFMFQYLPDNFLALRLTMSILLRIMGIIIALGLLLNKEVFRKCFIAICVLTIFMSPFKHPFKVFYNIAIYSEYKQGINVLPEGSVTKALDYPLFPKEIKNYNLKYPRVPLVSMISYILLDLVFSLSAVLYFTRVKVKESFK